MSQYFVSHEGQQVGPFELQEIMNKVKSQQLSLLDYIFDEGKNDWVLLMEHAELSQKLRDFKPTLAPKPAPPRVPEVPNVPEAEMAKVKQSNPNAPEHEISEWYLLKGENKFGPFAFTDVLKMLQQKAVFEYDFAWHPGMASWKRIAEIQPFQSESIKKLKSGEMADVQEVFFRRRHRRMNYNGTILVHDNKSVWKGQGMEISAGGAGVLMENAMLVPGQTLYLHFKPCDGVPPFNAICEIVNKQFVEGVREKNATIRYGLRFTNISANTQQFLHEMSRKGQAA